MNKIRRRRRNLRRLNYAIRCEQVGGYYSYPRAKLFNMWFGGRKVPMYRLRD